MHWRALLDITSGKVRQTFKIWTVRKPDIFLNGRWTFNTFKNRKKIQKIQKQIQDFFVYLFGLGTFDTKFVSRNWELWELITCTWRVKCLKIYISLDSVQSGRTCQANLGVWFCSVRKLICPFKFQILYLSFTQNANSLNFELWRLQI